ncbi:hypothetical protein CLCR_05634 [Cladophialophora carrionii]|uniref:Acyl-CoA synthetase family member 3, mitochondrial n=1 Tax=Cladophialophora carrionii TaxID=86049 RepID=A0A1C1C7G5_9EURO|nr:hypothetical protein CLCR_05634 [Cladophialophora carrionii]
MAAVSESSVAYPIPNDESTPTASTAARPRHVGPNIFPNFPVFTRLIGYAAQGEAVAIDDRTYNIKASYSQLLTDVLHVRNVLYGTLSADVLNRLWANEEVYFNLLAPASYEYAVAFLAILAIGGIIVPLSPALPEQEALYYVKTSRAVVMLSSTKNASSGRNIARAVSSTFNPGYQSIDIAPLIGRPPLRAADMLVSCDHFLDYHGAGLVIFTSGTTGPPKGALRRRSFIDGQATRIADLYALNRGDRVMHILPVHHATGIGTTFLPFLLSGACVEFHSSGFDPVKVWEHWRAKRLTYFSGVPTMYMRMMAHYETVLKNLPPHVAESYVAGARHFRQLLCGTSALPRPLADKWKALMGGRRILERYGTTEFSGAFTIPPGDKECPDGSVGKVMVGTDVKLSEGDQGEILVKSPFMFTKYIFDQAATEAAFDSEGYYRSGDIARKRGDYYFIMGRASVDILKSGGYKISALDVEREILGLDYVSEVMVVGVEDEEFGQRVAAAIVLKPDTINSLSLDRLRHELRSRLASYKNPTMLRVVPELRKTVTGKVVKKALKTELFPPNGHPDVQIWRTQTRPRL